MANIFFGKCKDLAFVPNNKREWLIFLEENNGKEVFVNIDKVKGVRSLDQNSLYWLYLDVIANETGHNSQELHRLFKGLFLPKKKMIWKGKDIWMSGSTTKLNKTDFGIYLERICAETSIPIPEKLKASIVINYPVSNESNTPIGL